MKLLAAALSTGLLLLAAFPALLAGGDTESDLRCTGPAATAAGPGAVDMGAAGVVDMGAVRATIRERESSGDYSAQAPGTTASGAYQFTDPTWAAYGGYARAADAPPAVQDAKAAEHVRGILASHGDIAAVPVVWYIGYLPAAGDPAWDTVPSAAAGNRLTPRQYQAEWLATYARQPQATDTAGPAPPGDAGANPLPSPGAGPDPGPSRGPGPDVGPGNEAAGGTEPGAAGGRPPGRTGTGALVPGLPPAGPLLPLPSDTGSDEGPAEATDQAGDLPAGSVGDRLTDAEESGGNGAGESGGSFAPQPPSCPSPASTAGTGAGGVPLATVEGFTVNADIAAQVAALVAEASASGYELTGSGYRSHERQVELRRQHCGTSHYAVYEMPSSQCSPPTARPGRSNHEQGLAVDVSCNGALIPSRSSACFHWLADHAPARGLHNLPSEPWHWSVDGT